MSRLDPEKLSVEFREGVTEKAPIIPRRYTLTHSDSTGNLYLTIGPDFAFDEVTLNRDEVLGEWLLMEDGIRYYVYLHMYSEAGQEMEEFRYGIFRRELPLALQAIRYGDRAFFDARPEIDQYPIIVYFLYTNPEENKAENWGTFADYDITTFNNPVTSNSFQDYLALIDEKTGDLNGDGITDKVYIYGDKSSDSDFIHNIIIAIEGGQVGWFGADMITELNGYNPTLFLGDFTKNEMDDILFSMDTRLGSMDSTDKGEYGVSVITYKDENLDTIFDSGRYNDENQFIAEYNECYKLSVFHVKENKLFFLDIRYKGNDYLLRYYKDNGKLIKPVQGKVLKAENFIPVVSSLKDNFYDLLAVHRIIGTSDNDTLGYLKNLLSWDGKQFITIKMMVCSPGTYLIPLD